MSSFYVGSLYFKCIKSSINVCKQDDFNTNVEFLVHQTTWYGFTDDVGLVASLLDVRLPEVW